MSSFGAYYLRYTTSNRLAPSADYPETILALCIARDEGSASLQLLVLMEKRGRKGEVRAQTLAQLPARLSTCPPQTACPDPTVPPQEPHQLSFSMHLLELMETNGIFVIAVPSAAFTVELRATNVKGVDNEAEKVEKLQAFRAALASAKEGRAPDAPAAGAVSSQHKTEVRSKHQKKKIGGGGYRPQNSLVAGNKGASSSPQLPAKPAFSFQPTRFWGAQGGSLFGAKVTTGHRLFDSATDENAAAATGTGTADGVGRIVPASGARPSGASPGRHVAPPPPAYSVGASIRE
eukprot:2831594-Prymnesium_polylepis.1